jgi:hypothetical protein
MKLWILAPTKELAVAFGYGMHQRMVVRAADESQARVIAQEEAKNDRVMDVASRRISPTPWLDRETTACTQLLDCGEPGVVIADFYEP